MGCIWSFCKTIHFFEIVSSENKIDVQELDEFIKKHDINVNTANIRGTTPLMMALSNRNYSTALSLIKYGAKIDIAFIEENNILEDALDDGRVIFASELIQRGVPYHEKHQEIAKKEGLSLLILDRAKRIFQYQTSRILYFRAKMASSIFEKNIAGIVNEYL